MALLLALGLAGPAPARTVTVTWPLTLDYPFIRSALVSQVYTLPGERALAAQADGGCTRVELWDPQTGPEGRLVKIGTRVRVRAGVRVLGRCLEPITWEGYIELRQRVSLDPATWELRFHTVDSTLYDRNLEPTVVGGVVWNLVKKRVHAFLDQFTINLAPPVKDLEVQLPLFFTPAKQHQVEGWLESLRPGPVRVEPGAVKVMVRMQVDRPPPFKEEPLGEKRPLGPEAREHFIRYWEAWDAYLVHQVLSLAGRPLSRQERTSLLSAILETRHGFLQALKRPRPGRDLVRRQFLRTWSRLAPIFRGQLTDRPSPSLFSYLAYFTASDALAALDALGPALGLDISRQGLVRLARLVDRYRRYPSLEYSYRVNDALRSLLDLGPPLPLSGPAPAGEAIPSPPSPLGWLIPSAWAGEAPPPALRLRPWLPPRGDSGPYLERLRRLLAGAVQKTLARKELAPGRQEWFQTLVRATAWQESCWRQFHRRGGKTTYLRSYNRSSVGLMQINERIWRGIYQPYSLRWDIAYNARAGCQILALYTTRYALAKARPKGRPPSPRFLAQLVYALYNGGPRQLRKFPRRLRQGHLFLSDRLFLQKYLWVSQGDYRNIHRCLGGSPPSAP